MSHIIATLRIYNGFRNFYPDSTSPLLIVLFAINIAVLPRNEKVMTVVGSN
jgi:hypothetical protein